MRRVRYRGVFPFPRGCGRIHEVLHFPRKIVEGKLRTFSPPLKISDINARAFATGSKLPNRAYFAGIVVINCIIAFFSNTTQL